MIDYGSTLGLLPDLTDGRVHAVYDPAEPCPTAVCGLVICPDIYLDQPGGAVLHRSCLAAIADGTRLRPAVGVWRLANESDRHNGVLVTFWRRWLAWRYERIIRRALAAERRRG